MSAFSKSTSGRKVSFKKHHVYEVSNTVTDAKHIANDLDNSNRYAYRARVSLVGFAGLRPYDPIYLDGLPNGMSGYWTVLSVRHVFGGTPLNYMLDVEVGTDIIGDVNPDANSAIQMRDVQGELSGQSIMTPEPVLDDVSSEINSTPLVPKIKVPRTPKVSTPATKIPNDIHPKFYSINTPTFSTVERTTTWKAPSNPGRVGR